MEQLRIMGLLLESFIEKYFQVKFSTHEINNWQNVGEMCRSISEKRLHHECN